MATVRTYPAVFPAAVSRRFGQAVISHVDGAVLSEIRDRLR